MNRSSFVALILFNTAFAAAVLIAAAPEAVPADHAANMTKGTQLFKTQVRKILSDSCLDCHGGSKIKGDFDLSSREALLKGGHSGAAIVVGDGSGSWIAKLMRHEDEPFMPHKKDPLPADQIAAIVRWIDLGAPYDAPLVDKPAAVAGEKKPMEVTDKDRQWWSFKAITPTQPPAPSAEDRWSRTPIDRFILAKLAPKKLTPSNLADKRRLLRRACFDLTGLPPTSAEAAAFLNDPAPDAYEKLIDRLLASPRFGERWARHWLDVARFAESFGFEHDYDRPYAYHFRDFVIQAFNQDMPFDQFLRWQLAGDELAADQPLALMATGFLGAGVFPTQLTEKEFESARYDEMDDMLSTTGSAMLGLSVGCARCHDHKFDPIPATDYYHMLATFTSAIRGEVKVDLATPADKQRHAAWAANHAKLVDALAAYERTDQAGDFAAFVSGGAANVPPRARWQTLNVVNFKSKGSTTQPQPDGSILVVGPNPNLDEYTLEFEITAPKITAIRVDALTHHALVKNGPGRAANGNFCLTQITVKSQPLKGKAKPVETKLVAARATHQQNTGYLSVASAIDADYSSGWAVDLGGIGRDQSAVFDLEKPINAAAGVKLIVEMKFMNNVQHALGRPRISVTSEPTPAALEGEPVDQHVIAGAAVLKSKGAAALSDEQKQALRRWFFGQDAKWKELNAAVEADARLEPQSKATMVQVTSEGVAPIKNHADGRGYPHFYPQTYFLKRGDVNHKGEPVGPGFLQALSRSTGSSASPSQWNPTPSPDGKRSGRRSALAQWITDAEHGAGSLAARVIVNRLWHHHFGQGIVATPNDFGAPGLAPTHPELLEYLAGDLIQNGWRLKPIHKLIMTSAAYMQDSAADPRKSQIDPENMLLWRYEPHRLEGEVIRDGLLSVSGMLDETMYGPGTLDESSRRRSIYFMVKRSKQVPMMQLFDAPEALVSIGARTSTTTAPQALMMINNPQVRRYAADFAGRILPAPGKSLESAIVQAYQLALTRAPDADELKQAGSFLDGQMTSYKQSARTDAKILALTDLCQVILSLNEFVFVD